jgi:hypothetical protein
MALDTSAFPERKVVKSSLISGDNRSFQMGHRWNLKLECGHVVACKNETPNETVKCMLCYMGESNG